MEITQTQPLKVDRTKLITQSEYAKERNLTRQRIHAMIKAGKLNTVEIKGTTLILLP